MKKDDIIYIQKSIFFYQTRNSSQAVSITLQNLISRPLQINQNVISVLSAAAPKAVPGRRGRPPKITLTQPSTSNIIALPSRSSTQSYNLRSRRNTSSYFYSFINFLIDYVYKSIFKLFNFQLLFFQ